MMMIQRVKNQDSGEEYLEDESLLELLSERLQNRLVFLIYFPSSPNSIPMQDARKGSSILEQHTRTKSDRIQHPSSRFRCRFRCSAECSACGDAQSVPTIAVVPALRCLCNVGRYGFSYIPPKNSFVSGKKKKKKKFNFSF